MFTNLCKHNLFYGKEKKSKVVLQKLNWVTWQESVKATHKFPFCHTKQPILPRKRQISNKGKS